MIHEVFQFLARLEEWNSFRRHFHLGARFRIASGAPASLAGAETAEATDLDFVAGLQRRDNAVEYGFDHQFRVFAWQFSDPRDLFDEVRLRHSAFFHVLLAGNIRHGVAALLLRIPW